MKQKINCGDTKLIPQNDWVPENEIQGTDEMVLLHPIINRAFLNIIAQFKPKHKIALVSLCTATRPYSKSRKWNKFINRYSNNADLIICSNGGIIPIEFELCYPYLTYDAHGQHKYDELYIKITTERIEKFFSIIKYETIVFNFRPNMRNRKCAETFKRKHKEINIFILPTFETYKKAQNTGFQKGKMFPDLDPSILHEIDSVIPRNKSRVPNLFGGSYYEE